MSDAFDLDRFAPADVCFTVRGRQYRIRGDVDVDSVARMLRIETEIGTVEGIEKTVAAVQEGRDLLLELIQEVEPDVAELKIGSQDLLIVFTLIMHGSSVAAAVADAISRPAQAADEDGSPVATRQDGDDEAAEDTDGGDGAPLASGTPSSARSSSSDELVAGPLVTGTA